MRHGLVNVTPTVRRETHDTHDFQVDGDRRFTDLRASTCQDSGIKFEAARLKLEGRGGPCVAWLPEEEAIVGVAKPSGSEGQDESQTGGREASGSEGQLRKSQTKTMRKKKMRKKKVWKKRKHKRTKRSDFMGTRLS